MVSPKFLFGVLVPAILIIVLVVFLKQHVKTASPAPMASAAPVPSPAPATEIPPLPAVAPASAPVPVVAKAMTEDEIQTEKDHLQDWQMNNDPQSLSNILADLDSPEKEIRMAAIDASVQFDDTNAIPILRAKATNDDDLDEKVALVKAADFLALPDVTFTPGGQPSSPQQSQEGQQRTQQQQDQNQNPPQQ